MKPASTLTIVDEVRRVCTCIRITLPIFFFFFFSPLSAQILTLPEGEEETQDVRQGKILLHTEYSLLSLLHDQPDVIKHHGFFQVGLRYTRVAASNEYAVLIITKRNEILFGIVCSTVGLRFGRKSKRRWTVGIHGQNQKENLSRSRLPSRPRIRYTIGSVH